MTRTDTRIKDAFTTKCPYEADVGETFLINMRETVDFKTPGSFKEYAFYNKWDNKVRCGAAQSSGLTVSIFPRSDVYKYLYRYVGHVVSTIQKSDLDQVLSRKRSRSS